MKTISYNEYRRRVFNEAVLTCLETVTIKCCEIDPKTDGNYVDTAKKMTDQFYRDLLDLDNSTITKTKATLAESVTFVKDVINISEAIANSKAASAAEEKLEIPADQEITMSDEDRAIIDKLFEEKGPTVQIDAVRNATVAAILSEDRKAQEIKNALDIAQSKVAESGKPEELEETVKRLSNRGPTSLMNAIMNACAGAAVKSVNENSKTPVSVGTVMSENAELIRNRATMMYTLYEASSVLGIHNYSTADVKHIADQIYYNK